MSSSCQLKQTSSKVFLPTFLAVQIHQGIIYFCELILISIDMFSSQLTLLKVGDDLVLVIYWRQGICILSSDLSHNEDGCGDVALIFWDSPFQLSRLHAHTRLLNCVTPSR